MSHRRRGVTLIATVISLIVVALAFSAPAFANPRFNTVTVEGSCDSGGDKWKIDFSIKAWEPGHTAKISLWYSIDGGKQVALPSVNLTPDSQTVSGDFSIPAADDGAELTLTAVADWKGTTDESKDSGKATLKGCAKPETPPSEAPPTTGGTLPFTGAGATGPMVVAALGLLLAGSVALLVSRRRRHAA